MFAVLVEAAAILVGCIILLGGIGWFLLRYCTVVEWPAEAPAAPAHPEADRSTVNPEVSSAA